MGNSSSTSLFISLFLTQLVFHFPSNLVFFLYCQSQLIVPSTKPEICPYLFFIYTHICQIYVYVPYNPAYYLISHLILAITSYSLSDSISFSQTFALIQAFITFCVEYFNCPLSKFLILRCIPQIVHIVLNASCTCFLLNICNIILQLRVYVSVLLTRH
jgi:hypothetical protein